MIRRRGSALIFGTALAAGTGLSFAAGSHLRTNRPQVSGSPAGAMVATGGENDSSGTPLPSGAAAEIVKEPTQGDRAWDTFEQVYALVKEHYVDTLPSDTKMARGSVRAMVASLEDPDSMFLEPAHKTLVDNELAGKFAGIGAPVQIVGRKQDGYTDFKITVVAPLPGSAAEKAGLKPGDIVSRIDGKYVLGYNPLIAYLKIEQRFREKDASEDDVEKVRLATRDKIAGGITLVETRLLLQGATSELRSAAAKSIAQKTSYALQIERAGAPLTVTIEPTKGEIPAPTAKTVDGNAAYLRVPFVNEAAVDAAKSALAPIAKSSTGLVLDLRQTPGGTTSAARKLVGILSGPGAFAVETGAPGKKSSLEADGIALVKGPITILIDRGTGGVAEAVAAGLQEKAGAALAGQKSFGDARALRVFSLRDGSGFVLKTGKLSTVKGASWAAAGLSPQIAIAPGTAEPEILKRAVASLKVRPKVAGATTADSKTVTGGVR